MERFTVFHFGFLGLIYAPSGAAWPIPVTATRRPQALPASGNEGRSRFACENEGLDVPVAQSLSCASRRSVKKRAGVLRPIRRQARDLDGVPLIGHARNRTTNHGHANAGFTPKRSKAESVALNRLVVPMHATNKLVSLR